MNRRGSGPGAAAASRGSGAPALTETEKKARKAARIKKRVAEAQDRITAGVEAIRSSEDFRSYLRCLGRFHRYSAFNNFLIHDQFPDATKVASESSWKAAGRTLLADQARHPIRILAPSFFMTTETDEETGEEVKVRHANPHRFVTANVYDISQTEGKDIVEAPPEVATLEGESDEAEDVVRTIADWCRKQKIAFRAEAGVPGGSKLVDGNTILIDQDLPHAQRALLFAQEAARAALVLDPKLYGSLEPVERELALQGASYAIAEGCGLDAGEAVFPAMARIAAPGRTLERDERKSLDKALGAIQKITHRVLAGEGAPADDKE